MCPLLSPVPVRHSNNTGVHYICPFCRTLDNSGSLSARHARKADKKSVQAHRPVLAGLGRQRGKQRRALVVAELPCEYRQRICNFPFELIAFYPQPPDAQVLSELSLPAPEIALETVQNVCGKLFRPVYHYVESTFGEDMEKLVQTLNEADPDIAAVFSTFPVRTTAFESSRLPRRADLVIVSHIQDDDEDIYVISDSDSTESMPRREDARQFPSPPPNIYSPELKYDNTPAPGCNAEAGPSRPQTDAIVVPSIVITPAPYQAPEKSAWVPIQDTCFGQRLTVPTHSALNAAHPPMLVPAYYHACTRMPVVRSWTYKQGHWCAILPGLDEQERRGLFSRPLGARRRSALASVRKRIAREPTNRQKISAKSRRES